jgi:hypothetical protein
MVLEMSTIKEGVCLIPTTYRWHPSTGEAARFTPADDSSLHPGLGVFFPVVDDFAHWWHLSFFGWSAGVSGVDHDEFPFFTFIDFCLCFQSK